MEIIFLLLLFSISILVTTRLRDASLFHKPPSLHTKWKGKPRGSGADLERRSSSIIQKRHVQLLKSTEVYRRLLWKQELTILTINFFEQSSWLDGGLENTSSRKGKGHNGGMQRRHSSIFFPFFWNEKNLIDAGESSSSSSAETVAIWATGWRKEIGMCRSKSASYRHGQVVYRFCARCKGRFTRAERLRLLCSSSSRVTLGRCPGI